MVNLITSLQKENGIEKNLLPNIFLEFLLTLGLALYGDQLFVCTHILFFYLSMFTWECSSLCYCWEQGLHSVFLGKSFKIFPIPVQSWCTILEENPPYFGMLIYTWNVTQNKCSGKCQSQHQWKPFKTWRTCFLPDVKKLIGPSRVIVIAVDNYDIFLKNSTLLTVF